MNIPETERRNLASSLVGTPGVDTSGQRIFNAISDASNQVAKTAFSISAERKAAKDAALANSTLIGFDLSAEEDLRKHFQDQSQFRGDKEVRNALFEKQIREKYNATLNSIPSRGARELFASQGESVIRSKMLRELEESDRNQGVLAYQDSIATLNKLAYAAAAKATDQGISFNEKLAGISDLMAFSERTVQVAAPVLDAVNRDKLEKLRPEMMANAITGAMTESSPEELLIAIDMGFFNDAYTPEKLATVKKQAVAALDKARENREIDGLVDRLSTNIDLVDRYKRNDPLLFAELETHPDQEFVSAFKKFMVDGPVSALDKAEKAMDLQIEFANLHYNSRKKTVKANLEDLTTFMVHSAEAAAKGEITPSKFASQITTLGEPFLKKMKDARLRTPSDQDTPPAETKGFLTIRRWFQERKVSAPAEIMPVVDNFVEILKSKGAKDGAISDELVASSISQALRNYMQRKDPRLNLLSGAPNKVLDTNRDLQEGIPGDTKLAVSAKAALPSGVVVRTGTENGRQVVVTFTNGKVTSKKYI